MSGEEIDVPKIPGYFYDEGGEITGLEGGDEVRIQISDNSWQIYVIRNKVFLKGYENFSNTVPGFSEISAITIPLLIELLSALFAKEIVKNQEESIKDVWVYNVKDLKKTRKSGSVGLTLAEQVAEVGKRLQKEEGSKRLRPPRKESGAVVSDEDVFLRESK